MHGTRLCQGKSNTPGRSTGWIAPLNLTGSVLIETAASTTTHFLFEEVPHLQAVNTVKPVEGRQAHAVQAVPFPLSEVEGL